MKKSNSFDNLIEGQRTYSNPSFEALLTGFQNPNIYSWIVNLKKYKG